ncbi:MAG: hypothetical protein F6J87_09295 [Spirulina sp. SIO3F2]|nr:hypothetical protein [Spirulina sp. SIO3F2]
MGHFFTYANSPANKLLPGIVFSPIWQRLTPLGLVLMLGISSFLSGSRMAIAQETPLAQNSDRPVDPQTTTNDTLENLGEAENADELSPRLRPAANSGDLVGDFFSVSVSACSLDPELLTLNTPQALTERGLTSARLTSQARSTQPSLWWARTRFGQDDLVLDWLIDSKAQHMNLIVDRARWSNLNYVGQYRVVHQFGTIAREQGYELRIFNTQPKCLAVYDCETIEQHQTCKVDMQPSRRDPFNFF